ncbi:MAG: hypothetical protein ABIR60_10845, partial [Allosphingosinicella sp.]
SLKRAVTVGSHIFYRWSGDWGDPKSFRRPYLAAEVVERPGPAARPIVRTAERADSGETTRRFGVTVRRGGPPPRFLASMEEAPERPAGAAGVRVHSGLPDFVEVAAADAPEPASATDVR